MAGDRLNIDVMMPSAGREPELVARTLSSLASCEDIRDGVRVFLIENGPEQRLFDLKSKFAADFDLRYLHTPRPNKSAALNQAIEQVGNSLLLFLDDDVRFDPSILRVYREAAERLPRRSYFGGPVEVDYESAPPDWLMKYLPRSAKGFRMAYGEPAHCPDSLFLGANWAAYADDIKACGGFDPDRGPGSPTGATGQESAMQKLLQQRGCQPWYLPDAVLWHWVPRSRCSEEWAIERKLKHSIEHVIALPDTHSLVRYPRLAILRTRIRQQIRRVKSIAKRGDEARFRQRFYDNRDQGLICGVRLRSEQEV